MHRGEIMAYKNIDQWKNGIIKYAKEKNMDLRDVQQRFILEEFAEKISNSKYRDSLIIKGGFVVSNLLGFENRTTLDMDATVNSTVYSVEEINNMITDIIEEDITKSFFDYRIGDIKEGQSDDGYPGYTVSILALKGKTRLNLKIDISNNTLIYPEAIEHTFNSLFSDKKINVCTYAVENIIAEKIETTLDRGIYNTRMRDLFDVYNLLTQKDISIDMNVLIDSFVNVSKSRNTLNNIYDYEELISELSESAVFEENFNRFKKIKEIEDVSLEDIFTVFKDVIEKIDVNQFINSRSR